ncbi:MAG: stage 0 sporulation family protein [Chloroflexi bacterium]|nr:stage 0 sporulation family protein [Chloroflexota bacterium]
MAEIVGVRFKRAGKVYYFDPAGVELNVNDQVVVETARGLEIGQVSIAPKQAPDSEVTEPLKPVVRKATPEDMQRCQELEAKEKEAISECSKLIEKLNLPMKLLGADYNLDGNHLTFYFSSVERVDFRELVRELARRLKVRVEMRQTGPRDEARLVGGCGRCGRPLCCASFLSEFAPVAMKMAKEQGLPLNPMKISGVCGRLMCCLGYENDQYRAMRGTLPKNGQWVTTASGLAKVIGSNPLKQTVQVILETDATVELPISEITVVDKPVEKQQKAGKAQTPKDEIIKDQDTNTKPE